MNKQLVVGKDYGFAFGVTSDDNVKRELVYNGGNSWSGVENGVVNVTMDDSDLTAGALAYINRPTSGTGLR